MSPQALTAVVVVLVLVALATFGLAWWRSRSARLAQAATAPPHPTVPPQAMLTYLADAVNNLNHEMRSCEIAEWFVTRLVAQAMVRLEGRVPCDRAAAAFDTTAIANAVPGANDVTRAEVARSLQTLVRETARRVCGEGGVVTASDMADGLRESLAFCAPPDGQLLALYPLKSRVPLPA
jgi:hypothetical protein